MPGRLADFVAGGGVLDGGPQPDNKTEKARNDAPTTPRFMPTNDREPLATSIREPRQKRSSDFWEIAVEYFPGAT